jgi:hypothetical protein
LVVLSLMVSLLSGCGSGNLTESYPLESVNKDGNATSYVYKAEGKTVPEVAVELTEKSKPDQISAEDTERMFLVYSNEWYHIQKDPENSENTLIEVDSKEYVQKNYDSSFLQGYITASIIGNLFDSIGRSGTYRGYSSKDVYKPNQGSYRQPTASDKKIVPPLTVEKKGLITRRGNTSSSSSTNRSDDSVLNRGSNSTKGSISRGSDSGSGIFGSSKKSISKPKTRSGSGKISRRSRR